MPLRNAAEVLQDEIARRESAREILEEGHPKIMELNESIEDLKNQITKLRDEDLNEPLGEPYCGLDEGCASCQ